MKIKTKKVDTNWEKLKDCLKYELLASKKVIKEAKKGKRWIECYKYEETCSTVSWVLDEIENLEEKGELL